MAENTAWKKYCAAWDLSIVDQTEVDDALNEEIPSMLVGMWNQSIGGGYAPSFRQGVQIKNGIVEFESPDFQNAHIGMDGGRDAQ